MKPIDMLKEIKNVLGIELSEETPVQEEVQEEVQEVALAQMTLENGTVLEAEAFEADNEVFIVTEDERVAVPVGEYTMEDGRILRVEEEGIIAEIAEASAEEEEVEVEAEKDEEKEMYATKEELAEIRSMVEEMYEYMKDKEEMSKSEETEELAEQVKEELSKPASEPLKHSPETKEKEKVLFAQKRKMSTRDRVFQRIANS